MSQTMTDDMPDAARQKHNEADRIDELADRLLSADSIAEDVPVLSELFHEARTSRRRARDGRYVALLDFDADADEWTCRSVSFLENGTHYRDTGADASVSFKPSPFLSVSEFGEQVGRSLQRDARAARQTASQLVDSHRMHKGDDE